MGTRACNSNDDDLIKFDMDVDASTNVDNDYGAQEKCS